MTYQIIAGLFVVVAATWWYAIRRNRRVDREVTTEMDKAHNAAQYERFRIGDRFECEEL